MADGDARGLEEQAAAAAEAARELRDAAAALAVRRAADEDALRRRAVALDGDLRRLQGSVAALDPAALDKVRAPFPPRSSPPLFCIRLIRIRSRSLAPMRELRLAPEAKPSAYLISRVTCSRVPRDAGWVRTPSRFRAVIRLDARN
jgi:hypothetical protein